MSIIRERLFRPQRATVIVTSITGLDDSPSNGGLLQFNNVPPGKKATLPIVYEFPYGSGDAPSIFWSVQDSEYAHAVIASARTLTGCNLTVHNLGPKKHTFIVAYFPLQVFKPPKL